MSQPIFRDSVINGKFLAGITTLAIIMGSIVLLIAGIGLRTIGVPPTSMEIFRLFFFVFICIFYGTFWMGLSIAVFSNYGKNSHFHTHLYCHMAVPDSLSAHNSQCSGQCSSSPG
ncbi:MAG: ABC transporter permease subunit [Actinomycetota bacterium]|nr:ABC transporter permease subunit [Actinomycetota bacterium]